MLKFSKEPRFLSFRRANLQDLEIISAFATEKKWCFFKNRSKSVFLSCRLLSGVFGCALHCECTRFFRSVPQLRSEGKNPGHPNQNGGRGLEMKV